MDNHWSDYWEQGHLTSFGADFSGNYSGVLKDIWQPVFENLPNSFKVLDICTGNGALPLLIQGYFENKARSGHIIGLDLASVQQPDTSPLNSNIKVELMGGVNCEELPVDGPFDLVMSQFGIEYSNLDKTLPEVSRVLASQGKVNLVCHHVQSLIIKRNASLLKFISNPLINDLWDNLHLIVTAMGEMKGQADLLRIKKDINCETYRNKINSTISALVGMDELAAKDSELLNYIMTFFKKGLFWSMAEKRDYIGYASTQIEMLKLRLTELVNAAIDEQKLANMLVIMAKHSLSLCSIHVIKDENNLVLAWNVQFEKIAS